MIALRLRGKMGSAGSIEKTRAFGRMRFRVAVNLAILAATSIVAAPSGLAAESGAPVADFSGYWSRPLAGRHAALFDPPDSGPGPLVFGAEAGEDRQGMPFIGDDGNPILLPHAADAVRAQRDTYRRGEPVYSAWALCWPSGVPLAFNMINAVQLLQAEDEVTIVYQRGQTIRHIYLDEKHPSDLVPSWFGHSVGHYEGADTLVVDTVAQDIRALTDRFGTPKSEAMRVVERYRILPDRQSLEVSYYVEDPETFATAWSAKFTYFPMAERNGEGEGPVFAEIVCPENSREANGEERPIPIAAAPDF
jgi:hypothetical protein